MPNIDQYMSRYDHEHKNAWNKILHGVGIPVIIVSVPLIFIRFPIGIGLFVLGWVLLFAGHRIEGNNPAFFQGPIYFLVGPVWVAKEIKEHLFGKGRQETAPR